MSDSEERTADPCDPPRIEVRCLSCGRVGSLDGDDRRVRGTPLVHLTRRLRCSECGSRAVQARTMRTPRDVARLLRTRMVAGGNTRSDD